MNESKLLSLGPWYIAPREQESIVVPFGGRKSKPKLFCDAYERLRRVQFVACAIQGRFILDRFVVNGESKLTGRCDSRNFVDLFSTFDWPLLGPGSKLVMDVSNPTDEGQMFAPTFRVQVYEI